LLEIWNQSAQALRQILIGELFGAPREVREAVEASVIRDRLSLDPLCDSLMDEHPRLGRFLILRIRGVTFAELDAALSRFDNRNSYDFAYELRAFLNERLQAKSAHSVVVRRVAPDRVLITCHPPGEDHGDWALKGMKVPDAWSKVQKGAKAFGATIRVGHPDTGFSEHPAMVAMRDRLRCDLGFDPPENRPDAHDHLVSTLFNGEPGHGTSTATLIASASPDKPEEPAETGGVLGVAPRAEIVPIRVCDTTAFVLNSYVAKGLAWAVKNECQVVSMSIGGFWTPGFEDVAQAAYQKGMILVCSAGNCIPWVIFPAAYRQCLAVGASRQDLSYWEFAPHDPRVDIAAPGMDVLTTCIQKKDGTSSYVYGYNYGSGGSYSTAFVAGTAVLWLVDQDPQKIERLGALQDVFAQLIKQTACVPDRWDKKKCGAGIVNADRLLTISRDVVARAGSGTAKSRSWFRSFVRSWKRSGADFEPPQKYTTVSDVDTLLSAFSVMLYGLFGREADTLRVLQRWFGVMDEAAARARVDVFGGEIVNTVLNWASERVMQTDSQPLVAQEVTVEFLNSLLQRRGSKALREALAG
jgi:hypothetical protein